jgi:hypothetical protein
MPPQEVHLKIRELLKKLQNRLQNKELQKEDKIQ